MSALTRTDAMARSALIRPISYEVRLDVDGEADTFRSRSTVRFELRTGDTGATDTFLDVRARSIESVTLNGVPVTDAVEDGRLPLRGLQATNVVVVDAVMEYSHDGEGLVRHVDPADGRVYLYAMSFLDAAPRWFACFDQPDLKAPLSLEIVCPPDWTVAGNAPAAQTAPGTWRLEQPKPIATYFATMIAGPYHSVRGEHAGTPLVLHARASLAEHLDRDADALLSYTGRCLDVFHDLFGVAYPWGEYHQAFVPDFNAGAMENPGCVTFDDRMVFRSRATDAQLIDRDTTIAHEMAHMWFGDLVTMRWWDDLWLNESFAEYLGTRVNATLDDSLDGGAAWTQFGIQRKSWGYTADRRPSTHPVAGNGAADTAAALEDFDGISYAKGASVLRQLAARLGDGVFLGGLRDYIAAHALGNAELADLLAAWTAAGASDMTAWAAQWLRTAGLDTLGVTTDGSVTITRTAPPEHPADRGHAVHVGAYPGDGGAPSRVAAALSSADTAVPVPAAALVLPDDRDETWAKLALPATMWAAVPDLMPSLDETARVVVWNALRLAVADAEIDPSLAVDIVTAGIATESDAVITNVLGWAIDTLSGVYLAPAARDAALHALATAAGDIVRTAPTGGGRQLAALRAAVAAESDTAWLRALLDGRLPDGIALDPDLRWRVLARLTALGACPAGEIDAAERDDRSSEAAENAAMCRALLPDPAAKATAWRMLMTDPAAANSELYATARGFWHPAQTGLTAEWVPRWFDEIGTTAAFRSGWSVSRVADLSFPWTAASRSTLESVDALLARGDVTPGIRRAVVDRGDDLRRAVVARESYGVRR